MSNKSKKTEQKEQNFLYEKLMEYCSSDAYPFHMPGHKRNPELIRELLGGVYGDNMPYQIDITEIDGFDNLHHAEEILMEGQKRAADLYGAKESFYLINGSTCGVGVCMHISKREDSDSKKLSQSSLSRGRAARAGNGLPLSTVVYGWRYCMAGGGADQRTD